MICRATLEQLDDLGALFDAYRVFYKQESDLIRSKAFILDRLQNKESIVFMAFEEDKAVGFTQLYPKYSSARAVKNWILNDLYVHPEYRKTGYGEQLIEAAMSFAKSEGAVFVQLETQVDNSTAQSLYQKLGFQLQEPDTEFLLYKRLT